MAGETFKQEREGLKQIQPLEVKIVEGGSGGPEVVGIKDIIGEQINPAKEDGNLALTQQDLRTLLVILQHLVNSPLGKIRIASDNSLVISGTISGTVYAIQSGTWNLGNFPYHQQWELIQRANIEYNECQRSKFTFV